MRTFEIIQVWQTYDAILHVPHLGDLREMQAARTTTQFDVSIQVRLIVVSRSSPVNSWVPAHAHESRINM